jgi:hypothetical protein
MQMNNKIIVLEQLPIIKYKLEELSKEIQKEVSKATKLVATVDNVKEIKELRAKLNKDFNELETQRKQVKQAIMSKYEDFEKIYKENVSNLYSNADIELKNKVNNVENGLKEKGITNIKAYFEEYCKHLNIHVDFDRMNLNITLTGLGKNLEGKKYKDEIKMKLDSIASDLRLIDLEEYSDEILLEYNQNMDFAKSKLIVVERHRQIEELKRQEEEKKKVVEQEELIEQAVNEVVEEVIVAPVEINEETEQEELTVSFTVIGTREQLKKVKEFLISEGIRYE